MEGMYWSISDDDRRWSLYKLFWASLVVLFSHLSFICANERIKSIYHSVTKLIEYPQYVLYYYYLLINTSIICNTRTFWLDITLSFHGDLVFRPFHVFIWMVASRISWFAAMSCAFRWEAQIIAAQILLCRRNCHRPWFTPQIISPSPPNNHDDTGEGFGE